MLATTIATQARKSARCACEVAAGGSWCRVRDPGAGEAEAAFLSSWGSLPAPYPLQVYLQDGGMLSNFPISLFHVGQDTPVCCPTFGVGLSPNRARQDVDTIGQLLQADITMSTKFMDWEFLHKNEVGSGAMVCRHFLV